MSRKSSLRLQAKLRLHHHLLLVLRLSHKVALQQNQLAPCSVPCRSFRRVKGDSERKKVDQTYDYRYSVLISVLAELLRQGWLKRGDLAGLRPDKIELIESWRK